MIHGMLLKQFYPFVTEGDALQHNSTHTLGHNGITLYIPWGQSVLGTIPKNSGYQDCQCHWWEKKNSF